MDIEEEREMAEKDAKLQKTDVGPWSWLWSWWWWYWSSWISLSLNCPRPGRRQGDRLSEAILLAIWNEWGKIQLHQGPVQIGIIIIINNTIIIAIINNTAIVGVEGLFKPIRGGYPLILWTASVTTFPTQNRSLSSFALFHLLSVLLCYINKWSLSS